MPSTNMAVCQNSECGKTYIVLTNDDGFCSFECWEKINCQTPQKKVDSFDMSELFETVRK